MELKFKNTNIQEEPVKFAEPTDRAEVQGISMSTELCNEIDTEPFEYFVDFDDPVGEPLTDDDLYNN